MEVKVALDTNRVTDLFQGDTELAGYLETCDEIWIPLVVLGELRAGFHGGTQQRKNEILLNRLLAKSTVDIMLPGATTAEYYGRVFVQMKRAGTPIPDNDLWIAALVLEHNLFLLTRDRHFDRVPQILRG